MSSGIELLVEMNAKFSDLVGLNRELLKSVKALGTVDNAVKKTTTEIGVFDRAVGAVGSKLAGFGVATLAQFAALASFEGLKAIGQHLWNLGDSAIHAAAGAERTTFVFRGLFGAKLGTQWQDWLDMMSQKTEFTADQMQGFAAVLGKAGYQGQDLMRTLLASSDMAALSGSGIEGMTAALAVFQAMKTRGFSSKQLTAFGLNENDYFETVANRAGMGAQEVEKAISANLIGVDVLVSSLWESVAKKGGGALGNLTAKMGTSLDAKLVHFKDIPDRIFGELENSKGLAGFKGGLQSIITLLDPLNEKGSVGKTILASLDNVFSKVGLWLGSLEESKIERFFSAIVTVGSGVASVGVWLVEATAAAFSFFSELWSGIVGISYPIRWIGVTLWEAFKNLFNIGVQFVDVGRAIVEGIVVGMKAAWSLATDAVGSLGKSAVGALKGVLGIHSPSRVFAELGTQVPAGFSMGVESQVPEMQSAMMRAFSMESLLPRTPVRFESSSARPTFAPLITVAGGAGGGGRNITVNLTVNMNGGDSSETAPQVEFAVRQAMQRVFEQMGSEA